VRFQHAAIAVLADGPHTVHHTDGQNCDYAAGAAFSTSGYMRSDVTAVIMMLSITLQVPVYISAINEHGGDG